MVFEYLAKGHTYEQARDELGVGITTIKDLLIIFKGKNELFKKSSLKEKRV